MEFRVTNATVMSLNVNGLLVGAGTNDAPTAAQEFMVISSSPTKIGEVIQGAASQSADLQQWQNSGTTVLAKIDASGNLTAGTGAFSSSGNFTLKSTDTTDGNLNVLFNGNSMGIRFYHQSGASLIEGVDYTGSGSYQPLTIGGSTVTIQHAAVTTVVFDNSGTATFTNPLITPGIQITTSPTSGAILTSDSSGNGTWATSIASATTATTQTAGDNSTKIATDAFVTTAVNNAIAGVNPAIAVVVATTSASNTSGLTYNNGVAGVGATFIGTANTALVIDGRTLLLGDRVLVKNDTQSPSGAFNGIYSVTTIQSIGIAPILTRSLDYDQPSDINNTGAIPVTSGTANAQTSWVETAQIVTVGTTPLVFTQFTLNPTTLMTTSTYDPAAIAQQVVGTTATQTVTNKRVTNRVSALSANSATPSINTDNTDVVNITAQTTAITSFTSGLSGTPVDGDTLRISVTGTTAIALTFGTSFEASTVALPTTTVTTARLDMGFFWNSATSKWRCVASA